MGCFPLFGQVHAHATVPVPSIQRNLVAQKVYRRYVNGIWIGKI